MKRTRRETLVYGTFGALTAAFVVSSIAQVVPPCFGLRPPPTSALPAACAAGLRELVASADEAARVAEAAADEGAACAALTRTLDAERAKGDALAERCAATPDAVEAFAEALRFERLVRGPGRSGRAAALRERLEARIALQGASR